MVKLTLHELKLTVLVWAGVYPDYNGASLNDLLIKLRNYNELSYRKYMNHYAVFIKNYYLG